MSDGRRIKRVKLGARGLEVTELAIGTLTMSPIQADIGVERGADVIVAAIDEGVTFIDTAAAYRTHPHVREALSRMDGPPRRCATRSPPPAASSAATASTST